MTHLAAWCVPCSQRRTWVGVKPIARSMPPKSTAATSPTCVASYASQHRLARAIWSSLSTSMSGHTSGSAGGANLAGSTAPFFLRAAMALCGSCERNAQRSQTRPRT